MTVHYISISGCTLVQNILDDNTTKYYDKNEPIKFILNAICLNSFEVFCLFLFASVKTHATPLEHCDMDEHGPWISSLPAALSRMAAGVRALWPPGSGIRLLVLPGQNCWAVKYRKTRGHEHTKNEGQFPK